MKKWIIVLMLLFLNILSPCYALPNDEADPNAEANPHIHIQVNQIYGSASNKKPESCKSWSYPSTNWPSTCPKFCSGDRQSPININTSAITTMNKEYTPSGYETSISTVNIKNNGHTMVVSWPDTSTHPTFSGGMLNGQYPLAQFHFHWGCDNSKGSEHTVDGNRYSMELHFVHYKTSYGSLKKAINYIDGLAVLGVFFNVGAHNSALEPITDNLYDIRKAGTDKDIEFKKAFGDLIPSTYDNLYGYLGSLTTPTCNQVVCWAVVKAPLELSQAQLDAFRSLKDHDGKSLCDNYREVQPLNGRTVYENV